jgi:hypothetical protein
MKDINYHSMMIKHAPSHVARVVVSIVFCVSRAAAGFYTQFPLSALFPPDPPATFR